MKSKEMSAIIARKVQDPSQWLSTIRMLVERAELDVTRFVPIGGLTTLDMACYKVLDEIGKHASFITRFRSEVTAWSEEE